MNVGTLSDLEHAVFAKRPVLGETFHKKGQLSLLDFTQEQLTILPNTAIPSQRKNEVITIISNHAAKILGNDIAESLKKQLRSQYAAITADHLGPLTDPGFFTNKLLTAFAALSNPALQIKNMLVLSCGNVSFDNDSFPRGHIFHSIKDHQVQANQLVFFPRKVRPLTVSNHPAYTSENIKEAKKRIEAWDREGTVGKPEKEKLVEIIDTIYAKNDILSLQTFSEQVTATNFSLWRKIFPKNDAPNLIYLEQEKIVNDLLLAYHLHEKTMIYEILFNPIYHALLIKYFDGITGGFTMNTQSGTFLFWGFPKNQKYRVQLWKKGNALESSDGSFRVQLSPHAIEKAIREKELLPSTLLSFIMLAFYYGMCLIGGGGQTTYLTNMKNAYTLFCKEVGNENESTNCEQTTTTHQAIVYPSIAFALTKDNKVIPATPLDLLLFGNTDYVSTLETMSKTITLNQALARALPEIFTLLFPKEEMPITEEEIDRQTGFSEHMKTAARI